MANKKPTALSRLSIGLLVALLAVVLYVLSIGPVLALVDRDHIPVEVYTTAYRPLWWLCDQSPAFRDALDWYARLWISSDS